PRADGAAGGGGDRGSGARDARGGAARATAPGADQRAGRGRGRPPRPRARRDARAARATARGGALASPGDPAAPRRGARGLAARMQMIDIEPKLAKLHLEIESLIGDDAAPLEAILAKVEALGAAETEMKKAQVGLMVRTRRGLTNEQRRKLDEVKMHMAQHG